MNGIVNVLKPPGMTSHDVVYFIRRTFKIKKVGHTGTLDPEAAGVLPVCIGKATKAVQYITDKHKRYRANIKFGIVTDTYDKYGQTIQNNSPCVVEQRSLEDVLENFRGTLSQKPPIYSALKVKGKKLYQYALQGEKVEIKERTIDIYELKLVAMSGADEAILDIHCSKGTYIRSLCHDIGQKLGCGAHMSQLIRLSSTPFSIESSKTLEEIEKAAAENRLSEIIEPIEILFKDYKKLSIKPTAMKSILNGCPLYAQGIMQDIDELQIGENIRIYGEEELIGIGIVYYEEEKQRKYIKVESRFI
jgi:tRNA pseudouridine55 synthase